MINSVSRNIQEQNPTCLVIWRVEIALVKHWDSGKRLDSTMHLLLQYFGADFLTRWDNSYPIWTGFVKKDILKRVDFRNWWHSRGEVAAVDGSAGMCWWPTGMYLTRRRTAAISCWWCAVRAHVEACRSYCSPDGTGIKVKEDINP